jgi:uncharacterized protein (DUF2225 family)
MTEFRGQMNSGIFIFILSIFVYSSLDQHLTNLHMAKPCCIVQGSSQQRRKLIDISFVSNQLLNYFNEATLSSVV